MTTNALLQFIEVIGIAMIFFSIRPIIIFATYYFKLLVLKENELALILPSSNEKNWFTLSGRIGRRQFALRTSIIGVLIVAAIQIGVFSNSVFVALLMIIPLIIIYVIQMAKRWNDLKIVSSSWSCLEIILAVIF